MIRNLEWIFEEESTNFTMRLQPRMINLYEILKGYPGFSRQLQCRGMLFTQYECPQVDKRQPL